MFNGGNVGCGGMGVVWCGFVYEYVAEVGGTDGLWASFRSGMGFDFLHIFRDYLVFTLSLAMVYSPTHPRILGAESGFFRHRLSLGPTEIVKRQPRNLLNWSLTLFFGSAWHGKFCPRDIGHISLKCHIGILESKDQVCSTANALHLLPLK